MKRATYFFSGAARGRETVKTYEVDAGCLAQRYRTRAYNRAVKIWRDDLLLREKGRDTVLEDSSTRLLSRHQLHVCMLRRRTQRSVP